MLKTLLLDSPVRWFAGPVFDTLVAGAIAMQRRFARSQDVSRVTAMVKTFERPRTIQRLLHSVRAFYPTLAIVVVDDSRTPVHYPGTTTITLPYDVGVSAGRKAGLAAVSSEFFVLLDDDFVFSVATDLAAAVAWLDAHPSVDIMGGRVIELPLFLDRSAPLGKGQFIDGLEVCDKVPNFFVARSERVRLVGWDPLLKRLDHADFFYRARGVLTTVFNPRFACFHARTLFDRSYMRHRRDTGADAARLLQKHGGRDRSQPW